MSAGIHHDELGIGLLGCGVVGSAVARAIGGSAERLSARLGRRPVIRAVAVRHPGKPREVPLSPDLLTDDAASVVERDDVEVLVEAIGGVNPAGGLIELALHRGLDVVTVNKELLARRWQCLQETVAASGRSLRYEGSVMAGVPVIGPLEALAAGDRVLRLQGLLNGTTNFCLHRMESGVSLEEALAEARTLGYTELDPSSDVDGRDAAAKLAILATVAFGNPVTLGDVEFAGVRGIGPADLAAARERGQCVRLVAEAWRAGEQVVAHVAPRLLPLEHPLSRVEGVGNTLVVEAELAGTLLVQGPGAGGEATAGAVLRDLTALATPVPASASRPETASPRA